MKKKRKQIEELTFADDFMFAAVLKNKRICKKFLEIVLEKDIADIEYVEEQKQSKISHDTKGTRLDVYVKDMQGNVFDVEMQNSTEKDLPKRSRYYQSNMDTDNFLKPGEHYSALRDNYVIFVCTFDPFGLGRYKYSFQNRCDEKPEMLLGDGTKKIFLNSKGNGNISFGVLNLLSYINGGEASDDLTRSIASEVEKVKVSEYWRKEYQDMYMHDLDMKEEGKMEGIEIGIAIGEKNLLIKYFHAGNSLTEAIKSFPWIEQNHLEELYVEAQKEKKM